MDPVSGAQAASPPALPPAARRAVRELEANFAAEMLRAARPSQKEGMFGRGTGAQAFDSFMDEALGQAMMARGGLGLGPALERAVAETMARGGGR